MNESGVYILDVGQVLFLWNGKHSSQTEKIKVMTLASVQVSLQNSDNFTCCIEFYCSAEYLVVLNLLMHIEQNSAIEVLVILCYR